MADTAALVVALSAQLTKFEKDMKDAYTIADTQTKRIETSFSNLNKTIDNQMSSIAQNAQARLGGIGNILGSIGPVGASVAVALGAIALGFDFVTSKVDAFASKAREMKESAETLGLSITDLKALSVAGQTVGLDFEQTERATRKLALSVQTLRETGSGPLFDALLKINKSLIDQVAGAEDVEKAIDVLSASYKTLNESQKLVLSTALFGQRSLSGGRILEALPQGGLSTAAQDQLNKGFSPDLIDRVAKLRQEVEAIQKRTDNLWGTAFAESVLNAQKLSAQFLQDMVKALVDIKEHAPNFPTATALFNAIGYAAEKIKGLTDIGSGTARLTATQQELARRLANQPAAPTPSPIQGAKPDIIATVGPAYDAEAAALEKRNRLLAESLTQMQKWTAVVGDALTQEEELTKKHLELAVAVSKHEATQEQANRQEAEFVLKQNEAAVAIKTRLGIASQQEIQDVAQQRVNADAAKYALSAEEAERGRAKAVLDSQKAYEAMLVAASKTPELTRFALDAANGWKQFDTFATTALSGFESALGSVANGTTKLADAFKSMANSIISDLVRMTVRMSVTGPLANALQGLFKVGGPFASASTLAGSDNPGWSAPLSAGTFVRQGGGPVYTNNPYIVGEHGPELFVPGSPGNIVPGSIVRPSGGGGMSVTVNNYTSPDTDVRQSRQQGPDGETLIIDVVKRNMARGAFDDTNRGRFGLRAAKVR